MKHLFKNFLEDHKTYVLAENFWSETIGKMLVDSKVPISKWLSTKYNDGERFYDGDPIFSLIHLELPRALRIVQLNPESEKPFINAWVEKRLDQNDREIDVLAITLELCEETKQIAISLIQQWFINVIEVNRFDNEFIERIKKNVLIKLDLAKIKRFRSYYFNWLANQLESPSVNLKQTFEIKMNSFLRNDINTYFFRDDLNNNFSSSFETFLLKTFFNPQSTRNIKTKKTLEISSNMAAILADEILNTNLPKRVIITSLKKSRTDIYKIRTEVDKLLEELKKDTL